MRPSLSALSASLNRLPAAAAKLVPDLPVLQGGNGTLYEVLSRLPMNGVGSKVLETRWSRLKFKDCYWIVTRARLKCEGQHGKAYGQLVWRGKPVAIHQMPNKPAVTEKLIRGGLKRRWRVFTEKDMANPPPPLAPPASPTPAHA